MEPQVELTIRRASGQPVRNSPVDGIRIMALLPGGWRKDLREATGEVVIRVYAGGALTSARIRAEVLGILADPGNEHWRLVSCRPVTADDRCEPEEGIR
ncbi:hypothetical protein ACQP1K_14855 [Sphaerimonospora sp. CA-214678]|uniref:hypothetical protein n=1 Tax=Sphaerimonospora sp. CA-214678 TaxID=3240029 RepID=UPI003D90EF51